jgi:hypothetical protein
MRRAWLLSGVFRAPECAEARWIAATPSIFNEVKANFLRVLWHPARVRILELLREEDRELADQQEILQDLEPS